MPERGHREELAQAVRALRRIHHLERTAVGELTVICGFERDRNLGAKAL
jgi:hypothetical protein